MSVVAASDALVIDAPLRIEFVRVPAGEFSMGSDPARDNFAQPDEMPIHRVALSEYCIGRYEITNRQYLAYARLAGIDYDPPVGEEEFPAVRVSWEEAQTFCRWMTDATGRTVRLPSEAEWEKAARGTDGRLYPWGDAWNRAALNTSDGGSGLTEAVTSHSPAGDSPYRACDMAGNVWEWTADWYAEDTHQKAVASGGVPCDPPGPDSGTHRVLKGGSHFQRQNSTRAATRHKYIPRSRCYDIGFRVVIM